MNHQRSRASFSIGPLIGLIIIYIDSRVLVCIFNAAMENKQKQNSQKLPKEKRGKKIKQSSLKEIQQSYLRVRECDIVDKGGGQIMV